MVCVSCCVRGVSGELARRRRQRPRTGAQSEVCPARSCERHEPERYQRTQQKRRHQQPRQPPAGTQLGECPGHALSLLPGRSVDIGQRTLRLVISVVASLQVAAFARERARRRSRAAHPFPGCSPGYRCQRVALLAFSG
jgi:hypothetical protein